MKKYRQFCEQDLIIASHNEGKIKEISELLRPFGINCQSSRLLSLIEPEETGSTYLENALIKARVANMATGRCVLSDDSGIELDALFGKPGVDTAPYTAQHGGLLAMFKEWSMSLAIKQNPGACFVCVQVLYWPDGHYESFEGKICGRLSFPPRGHGGHGYDPIFVPNGFDKTVAEMSLAEKNACSHRFIALNRLIEACITKTREQKPY